MGRLACGRGRIRPTTSATGLGDLSVTLATSTLMSISFGAIPRMGAAASRSESGRCLSTQAAMKSLGAKIRISPFDTSARNGATHTLKRPASSVFFRFAEIFAHVVSMAYLYMPGVLCGKSIQAKLARFAVCKNPQTMARHNCLKCKEFFLNAMMA